MIYKATVAVHQEKHFIIQRIYIYSTVINIEKEVWVKGIYTDMQANR